MTGPELKSWRERLGLSRAEAAELLDMSISYIEKAEVGKRGIHRTVELACAYLDNDVARDMMLDATLTINQLKRELAKAYEGE